MASLPKVAVPKIYGIVAREASVVALLVQVSHKWARVVRWDVRADKMDMGASFPGAFYPRRCDISPDGVFLCAFLMREGVPHISVSRLPWVFGLHWWTTMGTWDAGYVFSEGRVPVKERPREDAEEKPSHQITLPSGWQLRQRENGAFWNERVRGWVDAPDCEERRPSDTWDEHRIVILHRAQPRGKAVLRMEAGRRINGDGKTKTIEGYRPRYSIVSSSATDPIFEGMAWADWLADGRLVFSTWAGGVGIARVTRGRVSVESEHDLSGLAKVKTRAPAWARK